MSSVCPCCGQIVGSIPSPVDELRKQTEFEQGVLDSILSPQPAPDHPLNVRKRGDEKATEMQRQIDTSVSENDGDSEEHF